MMSDESTLLAERVGQLQQENETLKAALMKAQRTRWVTNNLVALSILIPSVIATLGLGALLWKVAVTPDVATHCRIDTSTNTRRLRLYGVVPWGVDQDYGELNTVSEGVLLARAMGCPLWPKEQP